MVGISSQALVESTDYHDLRSGFGGKAKGILTLGSLTLVRAGGGALCTLGAPLWCAPKLGRKCPEGVLLVQKEKVAEVLYREEGKP